jgi:superfamily II RNA helicase
VNAFVFSNVSFGFLAIPAALMPVHNSVPVPGVDLSTLYPFPLDAFQQESIAALDSGESVVVVAPTGSGKTLIGEYAIWRALGQGKRVFYTTPLKALSNQKLRDFRRQFGVERVGLVTGDLCINRDAQVLVMTTEIFRNILYGTLTDQPETALRDVEAVVLDECHYMNDRQRGTVWEESIVYCPPQIQLIALSATIANATQLTDWIRWVHGPTQLVQSTWRPVPLRFHFGTRQGLLPLLNSQQTQLNPKLKGLPSKHSGRSRQGRGALPDPCLIIEALQQRQMLPAIYFIFSRRGCDQAVQATRSLNLLTPAETTALQQSVAQFLDNYPELAHSPVLDGIYRGVAAHHAGLLPAWKSLTEELFGRGLIKVVFATETLAAGINMPARTTVISSLSKRTDLGHRLLSASEFLQMSGRAGRRGMDTVGHVVTMQTAFEGAMEAAYLATMGADPLMSQFTPSYGMVLNLLQTRTLEEARALIEKSFGQYIAMQQLAPQQQAITDLQQEMQLLQQKALTVDLSALQQYSKLKGRLKEEQRLLKVLEQQAEEACFQSMVQMLPPSAESGAVLWLQPCPKEGGREAVATSRPTGISAVLVQMLPRPHHLPSLLCLRQDNVWVVVTHREVMALHPDPWRAALPAPPPELALKPGSFYPGTAQTQTVAAKIPAVEWIQAPEVEAQQQRLHAVQTQIETHPAHSTRKQHSFFLRIEQRLTKLATQLHDRQTKLARQSHQHWQDFLCLVKLLQKFGALTDLQPTLLGKTAALLRGENELWLALVFSSGEPDDLEPQQLAALCAALVSENNRSDSWVRYPLDPAVQQVLGLLRPLRRQLIQAQHQENVVLPVWLETELIGVVSQWALGESWTNLCASTSLDEGDIVRLLRRTLDVLSQIPNIPYLSSELRQTARQAAQLIDRFPINEMDAYDRQPLS